MTTDLKDVRDQLIKILEYELEGDTHFFPDAVDAILGKFTVAPIDAGKTEADLVISALVKIIYDEWPAESTIPFILGGVYGDSIPTAAEKAAIARRFPEGANS
jgi:hypothetical protein